MSRQPIRGVIFDLFHTLTARESEWSTLPWTSDFLGIDRQVWNELLITRSRWRLTGEERDPFTIVSTLARAANPTLSDERIRDAVQLRIGRFRESLLRIPPENVDTLTRLRAAGLRLGLISNADVTEVAAWADSTLAGLFDAEIFSCAVGCVKPEPAIYEKCLAQLGLTGSECLFVGDGGSNELIGARDAGMTTVFISGVIAELWPEHIDHRRSLCDHHITRIPEVLAILGVDVEPGSARSS
jgi:putative hydrolase of the HAD superfamily